MQTRLTAACVLALAACSPLLAQTGTTPAPTKATPATPPKPVPAVQPAKQATPVEKQPANPGVKQPEASPGMEAEMAAWMATAAPGEHHKHLEQMAGEWDARVTSSWGGAPEESKATLKSHMRMGGRYLVGNFQGTMMGQPMVGQQILGYNNITKKYESLWRDNMGTGMMMETGTCDGAGKVITMTGETDGPDGKKHKSRSVTTIGDGNFTMQMFGDGPDGKEMKMMEIVYTRTKAPAKGGMDDEIDDVQNKIKKSIKDATDAAKPK